MRLLGSACSFHASCLVLQKVLQFQSLGTLSATSGTRFPRGVLGDAAMGVAGAEPSAGELPPLLSGVVVDEAALDRLFVRLRHSLNWT